ncbi:hypothetical protein OF820_12120 [Oceanotoga sp. DSM 15011]|jgi:hypothetical protein|uniref:Uncharacterized protein n=1 Tax=Oceanotoga teriensis TaxID=515440 RepID=A0AA45HID0_9BACT|nr:MULTISPECIES: hypothetical protein [Oceanotoga]MDN5341798.1 hypothetical protein [Oceanotoga sp.]MDO7975711.1 hypothetical protein [Oceanotoga teriensis]PWJ90541.1 hypothetical protein C7380_1129 [Oceanotoga teriensis]UYO99785.1 hypothetical protein OF820_12120 [Oceanotoga sp. DSM 15011]
MIDEKLLIIKIDELIQIIKKEHRKYQKIYKNKKINIMDLQIKNTIESSIKDLSNSIKDLEKIKKQKLKYLMPKEHKNINQLKVINEHIKNKFKTNVDYKNEILSLLKEFDTFLTIKDLYYLLFPRINDNLNPEIDFNQITQDEIRWQIQTTLALNELIEANLIIKEANKYIINKEVKI